MKDLLSISDIDTKNRSDVEEINNLYNSTFQRYRTLEQWRWEFLECPHGRSFIRVLRDRKGRIVGHWSFMPRIWVRQDRSWFTGKTENAMLVPEFRGKWVFPAFERKVSEEALGSGFDILWGTYSPAKKVHMRAGYKDFSKIFLYPTIIPFSAGAKAIFANIYCAASILIAWAIDNIKAVSCSFDDYVAACTDWHSTQDRITLKRDRDFLKWRYIDNPYRKFTFYRLISRKKTLGFAVLGRKGNEASIDDAILFKRHLPKYLRIEKKHFPMVKLLSYDIAGPVLRKMRGTSFLLFADKKFVESLRPKDFYFTNIFSEGI